MHTHEFLLTDDPEPRLEALVDLRAYLENRPPTAALWRPWNATDHFPHDTTPGMFAMLAAWPAPDHRTGATDRRQYVNPDYVHAHEYSDLAETCDCGYRYGYRRGDNVDTGAVQAHADDCSPESQRRAKLRLRLQRIAWLKQAALHWVRQPQAGHRIGFQNKRSTSRVLNGVPATYYDWYARGKELAATTMTLLRARDVPVQLIADAYGTSRQTVYAYKAEADHDVVAERAPGILEDQRQPAD